MRALVAICLMLGSFSLGAQTFVAKVSKTNLVVGENFQVVFEYQGDGSRFSPPRLDDFMLLSGPNKSSNMQLINGNFSSSVSYSFILRPVKEGDFVIGPASLHLDGKDVSTNPISIKVRNRAGNPQQPAPSQQPQQAPQNQKTGEDLSTNVFLKLFVNKTEVVTGEQLLATYKLYLNASILNYNFGNLVFNGFFAEELSVDASKNTTTEVINGRQFTVYTLKQTLLTPQKTGKIEIPALEMDMVLQVADNKRSRSLFDQVFGSYRKVEFSTKSNAQTITVNPMPQGKPADFSGAIGQFTMKVTTDRNELGTNEAINLQVSIDGIGNLELISPPTFSFPTDFETYDPKLRSSITPSAIGTRGSKTHEYVVIPRHAGQYELKPISFSYYDPTKKSYQRITSDPITITVQDLGTEAGGGAAFIAPKKDDVQIIGKDIRFIHDDDVSLDSAQRPFFRSVTFYLLSAIPFIGMATAIFLIGLFKKEQKDVLGLKRKQAKSLAKKHLKNARKRINDKDEDFYNAISAALFGYLSYKLSIPLSELNREKIDEALEALSVDKDLRISLKKALDECEMVRFAPGIVRGKEEMLTASSAIIEALENEI